ncbi:hypothetical protein FRC01_002458, partial [Tulasnella sp. 417]
ALRSARTPPPPVTTQLGQTRRDPPFRLAASLYTILELAGPSPRAPSAHRRSVPFRLGIIYRPQDNPPATPPQHPNMIFSDASDHLK